MYIEQGNVFMVPVLRNRLSFAVQVQRVVDDIGLGESDIIAVALPESIRARTLQAIRQLPRVSLVISSVSDSEQREVFPVTPADGIVEAVRIAVERDIPLYFVDQEVAPGHLIDHFCVNDRDWPDDGFALVRGAQAYLDLIADRLTHQPSRFEPVDSWRELHMAAQLQGLVTRNRRILFVCHATHIEPIRRLMRRPVPLLDDAPAPLPRLEYKIRQPSLAMLMRYLDHIPRLVEAYERQRAKGKAHLFDKFDELVRIMHELANESAHLDVSIRHYQAFTRILAGLLTYSGQLSPDLETAVQASESCFPPAFRVHAERHLLGYFDQVKVQRIGRIRGSKESVFEISNTAAQATGRDPYVARSCTKLDHYYEIIRVPGEPGDRDVPDIAPDMTPSTVIDLDIPVPPRSWFRRLMGWSETWAPQDEFRIRMRHKAFRLARRQNANRLRSHEFRGSMQDGVDLRRTLRSYYRGQPQLYVKHEIRTKVPEIDLDEPVLWLFDGYASADLNNPRVDPDYDRVGTRDLNYLLGMILDDSARDTIALEDRAGNPVTILPKTVHALLTFIDWDFKKATEENFRRLGGQLAVRMPSQEVGEAWHDFDEICAEFSDRYKLTLTAARWWEVLLVAALRYAKDRMVLVAPQNFLVPDAIVRRFAAERKGIERVSVNYFTRAEQRGLQTMLWLQHAYEPINRDPTSLHHRAFMTDHFGDLMRPYWG
ncbi:hypothetical protein IU450_29145 [Nocardia abscessus]|uniref:hypothetical protein n=1 Tax=Nocardia abscessus TaxID=120957 RepID=UPI001894A000|nr:hypothetical protein [Nocardia abscessus]MBF6339924.1 hypothetical protein [Nocardia abscessus]